MSRLRVLIVLVITVCLAKADNGVPLSTWKQGCHTHADCKDPEKSCCVFSPILGKRDTGKYDLPFYIHSCSRYRSESDRSCNRKHQYNESAQFYLVGCPCGPGLICGENTELDPKIFSRDRFGKCQPVP